MTVRQLQKLQVILSGSHGSYRLFCQGTMAVTQLRQLQVILSGYHGSYTTAAVAGYSVRVPWQLHNCSSCRLFCQGTKGECRCGCFSVSNKAAIRLNIIQIKIWLTCRRPSLELGQSESLRVGARLLPVIAMVSAPLSRQPLHP
ncbi:hypothetical protein XENTR_v10000219 [Xenopus tropicalis]|nr:hypothetical protein XENTR_v10000219 [Xenopus tropicalis]